MDQYLTPEQKELFRVLKDKFDSLYKTTGEIIKNGGKFRGMYSDTEVNRYVVDEWRNYLSHRAEHEGWEFNESQLEVKFIPDEEMFVNNERRIYNADQQGEKGYERIDENIYRILSFNERKNDKIKFKERWNRH